jgi:hypothetical protein
MPSETNHIDNFFRRKESASTSDKSSMDIHWQQMQELMNIQPAAKPGKRISLRILLKYAALFIVIGSVAFFLLRNELKKDTTAVIPSSIEKQPELSAKSIVAPSGDSLVRTPVIAKSKDKNQKVKISKAVTLTDPDDLAPLDKNLLPLNNKSLAVALDDKKPDNSAVFKKFFYDLEKQAEQFVINPTRDTTVTCKEGTKLIIPANTFQTASGQVINGPVTIAIKEFYSIADIVGNSLSTTSNGKQLATGGMINITASYKNEQVQIRNGSSINLQMPTRIFNSDMQLFSGVENSVGFTSTTKNEPKLAGRVNVEAKRIEIDTIVSTFSSDSAIANFQSGMNWLPMGQQQLFFNERKKVVTLFDVQDNFQKVAYRKNKSVAKYLIPYDCPLTNEEMQKLMKDGFGKRYDEVKIRRAWKPLWKKNRGIPITDWIYDGYFVGDSIQLPLNVAMRRKLITREDSIRYEAQFKKQYEESLKRYGANSDFIQKKDAYDFRITGLGWINCDRFLNYPPGRLSDFYVKTPEGFQDAFFASMLIFEQNKSAMSGYWVNGRINFAKLPLGDKVNVICLGAKDGKMYAAVQQYTVERTPSITLSLEEVTPEQFREKLRRFGNVQYSL